MKLSRIQKLCLLEIQTAEGWDFSSGYLAPGAPNTIDSLVRRKLIRWESQAQVVMTELGETVADEINRAAGRETYSESRERLYGEKP